MGENVFRIKLADYGTRIVRVATLDLRMVSKPALRAWSDLTNAHFDGAQTALLVAIKPTNITCAVLLAIDGRTIV